jgi:hypothetical protein
MAEARRAVSPYRRTDQRRLSAVGVDPFSATAFETRGGDMVEERSSWAAGYAAFAAVILMLTGVFHVIAGLGGIFTDEIYAVTNKWVLQFDATTWGWIHLIGGILVVIAAASIMKGGMYGRIIGTIAAVLSAIANFAWLPYQPWWSVLMIFLCFSVIWALTVHGRDMASEA